MQHEYAMHGLSSMEDKDVDPELIRIVLDPGFPDNLEFDELQDLFTPGMGQLLGLTNLNEAEVHELKWLARVDQKVRQTALPHPDSLMRQREFREFFELFLPEEDLELGVKGQLEQRGLSRAQETRATQSRDGFLPRRVLERHNVSHVEGNSDRGRKRSRLRSLFLGGR